MRNSIHRMIMNSNIVYVDGKTIKDRWNYPEIENFDFDFDKYEIVYYNHEHEFDSKENILKFVSLEKDDEVVEEWEEFDLEEI